MVLTRKVGEGIAIGDDVKIIVMQIKGKQVRLGIKASPTTSVHREEIFQKIQDENRAASASEPDAVGEAAGLLGRRRIVGNGAPIRRQVRPGKDDGGDGQD